MYKLFATAALAAVSQAVDSNCCELYTGEGFTGVMEKACLPDNVMGDLLKSYGYSFHLTGKPGDTEPLQDSLGSFKCGSEVEGHFCLEEPLQYHDEENLTQYKCNNLGFKTSSRGEEDAGPLTWMNLISSIVLMVPEGPPPRNDCTQTIFFGDEDCVGESFRPDFSQENGFDMGTGGVPVKSIWLKERTKIELWDNPRRQGDRVIQKNTFPAIPESEWQPDAQNNNCVCFNLLDHDIQGNAW